MCSSAASEIPWTAIVSGFLGIAGIAGTLLGVHLTNGASERRRTAEEAHEDRTRFHKDRVQVYARFMAAYKAYRDAVLQQRSPLLLTETPITDRTVSPREARAVFSEVREELKLIALAEVEDVADRLFGAAITLENDKMTDERFQAWDQIALNTLAEFRAAARAELLPETVKPAGG